MELLSNIILVVTIGFVTMITAYLIIQKVYEETRKNTEYAGKQLDKVFNELPNVITSVHKEIEKLEEERKEKIKKEAYEREKEAFYKKMNNKKDGDPDDFPF